MNAFFENLSINYPPLPRTPGAILRKSRKGRPYNIRPLRQSDGPLLAEFMSGLSSNTLLKRFFVAYPSLSDTAIDQEIQRINNTLKLNGSVLVATHYAEGQEEIIGIGEMIPDKELHLTAELALTVRDDYQGEGLGSALAHQLVNEASKKGLTTLQAESFVYNRPMLRIWTKLGLPYSFQTSHTITTMLARLDHSLNFS